MMLVALPPAWIDATWEHHVRRLRALNVHAAPLDTARTTALLRRFVEEFGDPDLGAELLAASPERAFHFERCMRPDRIVPARAEGSVLWLGNGRAGAACVRFERRRCLPALVIDVATLQDAWAASWPGAFVNFACARALVVSVHYEAFRVDLRGRRDTPYR
jgi:hypothetical protein